MKVTEQWIRRHSVSTRAQVWTSKQLRALGVSRRTAGWIARAVGREISDAQRAVFEDEAREGRERNECALDAAPLPHGSSTGLFRVTREWVHRHARVRGAWNAEQLAVLGAAWPPKEGWLRRRIGILITGEQKARFEALRRTKG
jgi:hypothetical protein